VNGRGPRDRAIDIVSRLPPDETVVPVQVIGELYNVLVRKAGRSRPKAREAVLGWHDAFATVETSSAVLVAAVDLAGTHRLGFWDSVILAAAASAGCRLLLSEDLQEGFTWGGLTVTNPMGKTIHPLLAAMIGGG